MSARKISHRSTAVVTGAGSGIGQAFALELARRGGKVLCADVNAATAEATAAAIRAGGGAAWAFRCDVSRLEEVEALADAAEHHCGGPVSVVVNNAGVGIGGLPVGEIPVADWQWAVGVNLWGVVHGCHVFTPRLRAAGHGGIVNVCSAASFAAAPGMGPYNVTKAAVLALSETLAAELAGSGVQVTALCPTFVKTGIVDHGRIPDGTSRLAQRLMDISGVSPESVAKTTLDALDRGRLYVLPQFDARLVWRLKRLAPVSYNRGSALFGRLLNRFVS